MTNPAAKGERFIAAGGDAISMLDIAKMLRARLAPRQNGSPASSCRTGWCAWPPNATGPCSSFSRY